MWFGRILRVNQAQPVAPGRRIDVLARGRQSLAPAPNVFSENNYQAG
jgi:hypothetical protein